MRWVATPIASARSGWERVTRPASARTTRNSPVCAQTRAQTIPAVVLVLPRQPGPPIVERLVDEVGQEHADEERALVGAGKPSIRPRRQLLRDAYVPEQEHPSFRSESVDDAWVPSRRQRPRSELRQRLDDQRLQ